MFVKFKKKYLNCGASLVEAALSIPVFIIVILFLIDIARYFFIAIFLNYAANTAVDQASKTTIEYDTTDCSGANLIICQKYLDNISLIKQTALDIASLVIQPSTSSSTTKLHAFQTYYDPPQNVLPGSPFQDDVAFLRPGEKALDLSTNETFDHPTRPFGDANEEYKGWPKPNENWDLLLEQHPIVVHFAADFQAITPLVPNLTIEATALGYRRSKKFGAVIPPLNIPTTTPTSTPETTVTSTPTRGGGGGGELTPSPTPSTTPPPSPTVTNTPTLTPTPTPTPNCSDPACNINCADLANLCSNQDQNSCATCNGCPCCNCSNQGGGS